MKVQKLFWQRCSLRASKGPSDASNPWQGRPQDESVAGHAPQKEVLMEVQKRRAARYATVAVK